MEISADKIEGLKISIEELGIVSGEDPVQELAELGRWIQKAEDLQAENKRLREALSAVSALYAETLHKVRVHCPKCGTLLARSGRCGRCG
jgi:predicted RNA-binding Zn-ribbon protein involved in translation (DUF1610 family)